MDLLSAVTRIKNQEDDDDSMDEEDRSEASVCPASHEILRYQDPIGSMYSGLHIAVINEKIETIWLLLLLASRLEHIPAEVIHAAQAIGVSRGNEIVEPDIRTLVDMDGRTAFQHAQSGNIGQNFDLRNLIPSSV